MLVLMSFIFSLNAMDPSSDAKSVAERAITVVNKEYKNLLEKHIPCLPATLLVEETRRQLTFVSNVDVYSVLFLANKDKHVPDFLNKSAVLQKTLIALRLMETSEHKIMHRLCSSLVSLADVGGFMWFTCAGYHYNGQDHKSALFAGLISMGAFMASIYGRNYKARLAQKRTIKEVYENEPAINDRKAFTINLEEMELKPGKQFAQALEQEKTASTFLSILSIAQNTPVKEEYLKHMKALKTLRAFAFEKRDIDAIITIQKLIEKNKSHEKNSEGK